MKTETALLTLTDSVKPEKHLGRKSTLISQQIFSTERKPLMMKIGMVVAQKSVHFLIQVGTGYDFFQSFF